MEKNKIENKQTRKKTAKSNQAALAFNSFLQTAVLVLISIITNIIPDVNQSLFPGQTFKVP